MKAGMSWLSWMSGVTGRLTGGWLAGSAVSSSLQFQFQWQLKCQLTVGTWTAARYVTVVQASSSCRGGVFWLLPESDDIMVIVNFTASPPHHYLLSSFSPAQRDIPQQFPSIFFSGLPPFPVNSDDSRRSLPNVIYACKYYE